MKFLNKKTWHTGKIQNIEKVWIAEQKKNAEKTRMDELKKQLAEERAVDDLRRVQASSGLITATHAQRLEWMYQETYGQTTSEEYLQGKEMRAKTEDEDVSKLENKKAAGSLMLKDTVNSELEAETRLREDPMMLIMKKEHQLREQVVKNPLKMAQIKKAAAEKLKLLEKLKKATKKHKKREKKDKKRDKRSSSRGRKEVNEDDESDSDEESRKGKRDPSPAPDVSPAQLALSKKYGLIHPSAITATFAGRYKKDDNSDIIKKEEKDQPRQRSRSRSPRSRRERSRSPVPSRDTRDRAPSNRADSRRERDRESDRERSGRDSTRERERQRSRSAEREKRRSRSRDRERERRGRDRDTRRDRRSTSRDRTRSRDERDKGREQKSSTSTSASTSSSTTPAAVPYKRKPFVPPKGLSQEELQKRLEAMKNDAEEHEKSAIERVRRQREEEKREAEELRARPVGEEHKAAFLEDMATKVYSGKETVEDRLKKYAHYRQKGNIEEHGFLKEAD